MNQIQWFPGHMAKARRQITEKLKLVDVIIELLDARLPLSSRNPMIDEIVKDKPRLILLNKSDLADGEVSGQWIGYFAKQGLKAIPIDSLNGKGVGSIPGHCRQLVEEKTERIHKKGIQGRPVRTMVLGIPNVGKSSLINRMARRKVAKTGGRPAVTRQQQWVKLGELDLLDTPGVLWPKFDDPLVGLRLAASGAIKDEILDFQEVAHFLIDYVRYHYPLAIKERYRIDELASDTFEIMDQIGSKRGFLRSGGVVDRDKAAEVVLREYRSGKWGLISLERPDDPFTYQFPHLHDDEMGPLR